MIVGRKGRIVHKINHSHITTSYLHICIFICIYLSFVELNQILFANFCVCCINRILCVKFQRVDSAHSIWPWRVKFIDIEMGSSLPWLNCLRKMTYTASNPPWKKEGFGIDDSSLRWGLLYLAWIICGRWHTNFCLNCLRQITYKFLSMFCSSLRELEDINLSSYLWPDHQTTNLC